MNGSAEVPNQQAALWDLDPDQLHRPGEQEGGAESSQSAAQMLQDMFAGGAFNGASFDDQSAYRTAEDTGVPSAIDAPWLAAAVENGAMPGAKGRSRVV